MDAVAMIENGKKGEYIKNRERQRLALRLSL
jgi:hypothetical protein